LNLSASLDDLLKLRAIRTAHWDDRRSIRAGRSAGSNVFWCCAGENVTVMIGEDDETWDVAVDIPISVVDEIIAKAITVSEP
jgi:hypothetical protein